jgi:hypothetical protein
MFLSRHAVSAEMVVSFARAKGGSAPGTKRRGDEADFPDAVFTKRQRGMKLYNISANGAAGRENNIRYPGQDIQATSPRCHPIICMFNEPIAK